MDPLALKRQLRASLVEDILALSPADRAAEDAKLLDRFEELEGRAGARTILLYVSAFPEEIETRPYLEATLAAGQTLVCPRVDRQSKSLRLFQVRDPSTDLVAGTLGIPEPRKGCPEIAPEEVDWALVPGLAFDDRGHRLGRGAGHYDRLLPKLRPEVLRWSLCLDCQWVSALPDEPHDARLDGIASPSRLVRVVGSA